MYRHWHLAGWVFNLLGEVGAWLSTSCTHRPATWGMLLQGNGGEVCAAHGGQVMNTENMHIWHVVDFTVKKSGGVDKPWLYYPPSNTLCYIKRASLKSDCVPQTLPWLRKPPQIERLIAWTEHLRGLFASTSSSVPPPTNCLSAVFHPASLTFPASPLKHYLDPAEQLRVRQARHSVTTQGLLGTQSVLTCDCDDEEVMLLWRCRAGSTRCWNGGG